MHVNRDISSGGTIKKWIYPKASLQNLPDEIRNEDQKIINK